MVEAVRSEAEAMLVPGPVAEIGDAVSVLLGTFPSTGGDNKARGAGFRMALEDLPAWAVLEGVKRWLRGEDGDGSENYSFAPSPPQLRRLAIRARMLVEGRIFNLTRLLEAKVMLPESEKVYVEPAKLLEALAAVKLPEMPKAAVPNERPNLSRVLDECEARQTRRAAGTAEAAE